MNSAHHYEYRQSILNVLKEDMLLNQRSMITYYFDFDDSDLSTLIKLIFEISNSDLSEVVWIDSEFNHFLCKIEDFTSKIPARIVYDSLITGINNKYQVADLSYSYLNLPFSKISELTYNSNDYTKVRNKNWLESEDKYSKDDVALYDHLKEYFQRMLLSPEAYIQHQSNMLQTLTHSDSNLDPNSINSITNSFRSPLNFLMVKHDFRIFTEEYVKWTTKLKYGYQYLKSFLLTPKALETNTRAKFELASQLFAETDYCRENIGSLLEEYSHLVNADDYQCDEKANKHYMWYVKRYVVPIGLGVIMLLAQIVLIWKFVYSQESKDFVNKKRM